MKPLITLALTLVLTAALLVGCGCTNRNIENTPAPTVLPTNEEMWNTTEAPTRGTTEATTPHMTTDPTANTTRETIDNGNGGIDDSLLPTSVTETTTENRARTVTPSRK